MRKLYEEFFHVPKHGKIREKVMLMRVARTVIMIILCLVAMGVTAYAYFSHDFTSASNKIQSANFETNINIKITDENGEAAEVITSNYKSHVATLEANTKYFITLKPTERSTAKTGFVVVSAEGCEKTYHTQQLGVDGEITRQQITFSLVLDEDAKVTFLAHWGTSSYYGYNSNAEQYIISGETVQISVRGTTSAEVIHTVVANENLTKIANLYGSTPSRIAAYNGIAIDTVIRVGSTLKIPPNDWEIPADEETPTTTTTKPTTSTVPPTSSTATKPAETTTPEATELTPSTTTDESSANSENNNEAANQ